MLFPPGDAIVVVDSNFTLRYLGSNRRPVIEVNKVFETLQKFAQ